VENVEKTVFQHFKDQGVQLKEDDKLIKCQIKGKDLYFP